MVGKYGGKRKDKLLGFFVLLLQSALVKIFTVSLMRDLYKFFLVYVEKLPVLCCL